MHPLVGLPVHPDSYPVAYGGFWLRFRLRREALSVRVQVEVNRSGFGRDLRLWL